MKNYKLIYKIQMKKQHYLQVEKQQQKQQHIKPTKHQKLPCNWPLIQPSQAIFSLKTIHHNCGQPKEEH